MSCQDFSKAPCNNAENSCISLVFIKKARIENPYISATGTRLCSLWQNQTQRKRKGSFSIFQDCFFVYAAIDCSLKNLLSIAKEDAALIFLNATSSFNLLNFLYFSISSSIPGMSSMHRWFFESARPKSSPAYLLLFL